MSGISFTQKGDFSKLTTYLNKLMGKNYLNVLEKYAQEGVKALAASTPSDTGNTANAWGYEITHDATSATIAFTNSNINKGCNIAILLQYGHGTGTGGYVAGRDYINPTVQPLFDKMAQAAWEEVSKT